MQFSSRCLFDVTGRRGGHHTLPLGIAPGAVCRMQRMMVHACALYNPVALDLSAVSGCGLMYTQSQCRRCPSASHGSMLHHVGTWVLLV